MYNMNPLPLLGLAACVIFDGVDCRASVGVVDAVDAVGVVDAVDAVDAVGRCCRQKFARVHPALPGRLNFCIT